MAENTLFVIISDTMGLFWSNEDGWTDRDSATVFTAQERDTLRLPLGGMWIIA